MFISQAFAQTSEAAAQVNNSGIPENYVALIQIALVFLLLYFLIWRPQQKRMKAHQLMLSAIVKGNQVNLNGIKGTVKQVKDSELTVEIAKGVEITVLRDYVTQVIGDADNNKKK